MSSRQATTPGFHVRNTHTYRQSCLIVYTDTVQLKTMSSRHKTINCPILAKTWSLVRRRC